ncbi:MAG: cutinase family protein [Mycolicibacterium sp.]|uniref:cutinase family protein n=1 Tax=Mycolicibacterium sp. TaxID=2320850 RepID=UPI003D122583
MRRFSLSLLLSVLLAGASGVSGGGAAIADPCPDIEVVYARGTGAPPGIGIVGQAFVDALRTKVGGRSMAVYGVNYPASRDFGPSASAGAVDARDHVQATAAACPNTRIVLGGTSQGAGVIALITGAAAPRGFTPAPLSPEVADHVAAVAVFGNPTRKMAGGPLPVISPVYGPKSIDLCAGGDPFCSDGLDLLAHTSYGFNGMTNEAADFVAGRL